MQFFDVDDKLVILDRRAGRIESGTDQLAAAVHGMQIAGRDRPSRSRSSASRRAVLRAPGLGPDISDVDPHEGRRENPRAMRLTRTTRRGPKDGADRQCFRVEVLTSF